MADRLREIPARIMEWWNKFTTRQKSIIVGISAAAIFIFAIVIYFVSKPQYVQLKTCDTTADAAKVIDILESNAITHRESTDGLKIEVLSAQVSAANIALGAAGYVPDDYGLESALQSSFSTTSADTEKRYKLYLEKKLENDFEAMSMVNSARVTLTIPAQDGTLIYKKEDSTAYIQLDIEGTFTSANAATVARAAATALGNDTTANITIVDYNANLLFAGGDEYSTAGIANSYQELQNQAESQVANKVKTVLIGTNQYENVTVMSHLNMDFATYQDTVKEYYANDDRTEGMLAESQTFESENTNGVGGVPGTDSNNEGTYTFQNAENSSSSQTETAQKYLPNEHARYSESVAGAINWNNSSVAISAIKFRAVHEEDVRRQGLLDGGITWDDYKLQNSQDVRIEVDPDFYSLVANTTGIDQSRITIIAYESPLFYDEERQSIDSTTVMSIVLFILIIGLLAFVVLRSMLAGRAKEAEEQELSVEDLLQSTPESEISDIDVEAKSETRKMIEKFVDENPEAVASLLRNWLNEDWG